MADLQQEQFQVVAPMLPVGAPASLHLSVGDASGDSAIFEYIGGKLNVHHRGVCVWGGCEWRSGLDGNASLCLKCVVGQWCAPHNTVLNRPTPQTHLNPRSKDYKIMTNDPPFEEQLAIERQWRPIGGTKALPVRNSKCRLCPHWHTT